MSFSAECISEIQFYIFAAEITSSSMSSADRVQVTYNLNENTQTVSSPLTYAFRKGSAPSTCLPEAPSISNIKITSAVAGVPPSFWVKKGKKKENEEESEVKSAFPASTYRVTKLSFDMDHVSPPIANLFRRVLSTEVPTLAFDRILIEENDSLVMDELLSHRLGLVPLAGPVHKMEYVTALDPVSFEALDPTRVLIFELDVTGKDNDPSTPVYSSALKWVPLPGQEEWEHSEDDRVFLVHSDIMLTKLGPKQRLKLRAMAIKGLGSVHTKWCPVSSCYYELKTEINLLSPITGDAAEKLVAICPKKVFEIEESTRAVTVSAPEQCSLCRECLRKDAYPEIAESVQITKLKTSVRFHIESIGQIHASNIFRNGLTLFAKRCRELSLQLQNTEVTVSAPR